MSSENAHQFGNTQCQAFDPETDQQCPEPADYLVRGFYDGRTIELCSQHLAALMAHEAVAVVTPVTAPPCRMVQPAVN